MAQQVQIQKIFLSSPQHWDVWIKAVKTQALAKEVWSFIDPEGTGPAEPTTPQEVTLEAFIVKHGITLPANPPGITPPTGNSQGPTPNTNDEDPNDGLRTPSTLPAQPP